ncbi:unnamed protein product [Prorocentrum cordatum]|uniref:Uncharacterized protein n=1 Tax=Prorocentrum cordatum TaxID=2364126 RepID=A0ABN9V8N5_9DINO|nr:unnamed protein product [Polarella glacialis]
MSLLHSAAGFGHLAVAKVLLDNGADPHARDRFGYTPLIFAAAYGHLEITKVLLAKRADPNAKNIQGWTSLHRAAARGHRKIVMALLELGADVHAIANGHNGETFTPLSIARFHGRQEVIAVFTEERKKELAFRHEAHVQAFRMATDDIEKFWEIICPELIPDQWVPRQLIHAGQLGALLAIFFKSGVADANPDVSEWIRKTHSKLFEYLLRIDACVRDELQKRNLPMATLRDRKSYLAIPFYMLEMLKQGKNTDFHFEVTRYFSGNILTHLATCIDDPDAAPHYPFDELLCASFAGCTISPGKLRIKLRTTMQHRCCTPKALESMSWWEYDWEPAFDLTHAICFTFLTGTLVYDFTTEQLLAKIDSWLELVTSGQGLNIRAPYLNDLAAELLTCRWLVGGGEAKPAFYAQYGEDIMEASAFVHLRLNEAAAHGSALLQPVFARESNG